MSNQIKNSQRKNLLFIFVALIILMIAVNITIYWVSNTFMENKIKEETNEFLLLTTYLIDENDLSVAIEYVGHYSDSHHVEVEILDGDTLLYSSVDGAFNDTQHTITTNKGEFNINIDNSHSVTVDLLTQKYLYGNIISVVLFIFTITTLYIWNRRTSVKIENDVDNIMHVIHHETPDTNIYEYTEFQKIHDSISEYITEIDMHRERKQLNIKGLAHDIKTPLTVINNFLQVTDDNSVQKENSVLSLQKISRFIDSIIEDDYRNAFFEINLHKIISDSITYYKKIFTTKNITISYTRKKDCIVLWNQRDFKVILENLLSNAYYYSDSDSTFDISLSCSKEETVMKFTSVGNVKDLENINNIFSKGYRDNSTKDLNSHGKGIGLYITKLLLVPINGTISASTNGDAITFKITIKKD